MMIDVGSAAAGRPQDRPRSRRTRQTQSGNAVGFPRRRIRRRSFQFLLVTRNVRGIPVYFFYLSLSLNRMVSYVIVFFVQNSTVEPYVDSKFDIHIQKIGNYYKAFM
jgi:hypothetical protein